MNIHVRLSGDDFEVILFVIIYVWAKHGGNPRKGERRGQTR